MLAANVSPFISPCIRAEYLFLPASRRADWRYRQGRQRLESGRRSRAQFCRAYGAQIDATGAEGAHLAIDAAAGTFRAGGAGEGDKGGC